MQWKKAVMVTTELCSVTFVKSSRILVLCVTLILMKADSIALAADAPVTPNPNAPAATNAPVVTKASMVADAAATAVPDAHLDYTPGKAPKFWSIATAETIMARWPDYSKAYFSSWTYVNGYALYGFDMLYRATGDKKYFGYTKRYIDQFIDKNGNFHGVPNAKGQTRDISFSNLDNMMTGNTVVMMYEYTKDERYKKAAEKIRRAFDDYPRNNDGGFWHARGMHGQMWIDGIFMGQMFLTRYGKSIGDTQYCWDEATKQVTVYAKRAQRGDSGLYQQKGVLAGGRKRLQGYHRKREDQRQGVGGHL
jgi:hypothetical protein